MNWNGNQSSIPSGNSIYLEHLNDQMAATKLGGVVFVGILMIIGVIGNMHVLYIYTAKFKRSTHRVYILCLAIVDTVTCCIGMPFVIIDLQYPLMFSAVVVCKILRFMNYFMCSGSAIILVVIAVDRYQNICHPFDVQMSENRAKIACGISLFVALCLSWPAAVLYGYSNVGTDTISSYLDIDVKVNITGTQCFTEDKYFRTPYQTIFNIILIGIILVLTTVLAILYSLICRSLIIHVTKLSKMTANFKSDNSQGRNTSAVCISDMPPSSSDHGSSVGSSGTQTESLHGVQISEQITTKKTNNVDKNGIRTIDTSNENEIVENYSRSDRPIVSFNSYNDELQVCTSNSEINRRVSDKNDQKTSMDQIDEQQKHQHIISKNDKSPYSYNNKSNVEVKLKNPISSHEQNVIHKRMATDYNNCRKDELLFQNYDSKQDTSTRADGHLETEMYNSFSPGICQSEHFSNDDKGIFDSRNVQTKNLQITENNGLSNLENIPKLEKRWDVKLKSKSKSISHREKQTKRITLMLFIITLVFVLSFTPHLALKTIAFLRKDFITNLSPVGLFLYNTFVWSFFINNMANPIIYGFCDSTFRKKIKKTYRSCILTRKYNLR